MKTKSNYHTQAHCQFVKPSGENCGCIALRGSLYCQHHSSDYVPKQDDAKPKHIKRYNIDNTLIDNTYERNLNADNIYSLRDEIALLQTHLQGLLSSHCALAKYIVDTDNTKDKLGFIKQYNYGMTTQLQLIDRLEKLIKMTKDLEFKEKASGESSLLLRNILSKVVFIINTNVQDMGMKRQIAEELWRIGQPLAEVNERSPCSTIEQQPKLVANNVQSEPYIQPLVYEQANTTTYGIVSNAQPLDNILNDTTKVSLCIDSQGK